MKTLTIAAVLALALGPAVAQDDAYHIARFRGAGVVGGFGPSGTWAPPFLPQIFFAPQPVFVPAPPVIVAPPPPVYAPPPLVLAPPPPPPAPICIVNLPPWEWLNLRVAPNGSIIGPLPSGTPLALFNVVGSWGFVQTPRGTTGWTFLPFTICRLS